MPGFGVTPTGFVLPGQQDLLDLVVADQKAIISSNVDTSSDSVLGQINGVFTRQLMAVYEAVQVAYSSNDPDVVEGFLQTQLAKLTGTPRLAARPSTVPLSCVLAAGTTLIAGTTLVGIAGNPSSQWTPAATYTAATTGTFAVPFQNIATGPNAAAAGTITVITTPVTGWNGVTNLLDAALGTDIESDTDLRIRREQELQGSGASTAGAIRAALLKIGGTVGPFITTVTVLHNESDVVDANGLPPHSFEPIIYEAGTAVANNTIAQTIWDESPAGIRSYGALSGAAIDAQGNAHTVFFSRVTQVPIYIAFAASTGAAYVGLTAFKAQVAAACTASFGGGIPIDPYSVIAATFGLGANISGMSDDTAPIGSVPVGITTTTIPIGPLQIGTFDSSRITINGA